MSFSYALKRGGKVATEYKVDYNDKRFTEVEADKKAALNEVEAAYGGMINAADAYYQKQIDAANAYAEEQKRIQQQQTDFAIEQINQQKAQATKDYTREQSGAYVDWQKQSNEYGAKAERMAAMGMANTGYSESSQVGMYNAYQNRVATARETYTRTIANFDNAIHEARLQNNAALAEIAFNAMQAGLELSLEGFQYKNNLITAKMDQKQSVNNNYYARYQDVLDQINREQETIEDPFAIPKVDLVDTAVDRFTTAKDRYAKTYKPTYEVDTPYYHGNMNSDAKKYGTFSNGYQPKGINGHGEVSKTGMTIQIATQTLSGENKTVVQNVWETKDGKRWYWEGRQNRYIEITG